MYATADMTIIGWVLLTTIITWFSGVALLNTSIAIRYGFHPIRGSIVSPIWPVMLFYEPLKGWAQYDGIDDLPSCVQGYAKVVNNA